MAPFTVLKGIVLSIWAIVDGGKGPDEIVWNLENRTEFLRARIEDIKSESLFNENLHGKKRKREDDIFLWVSESEMLLEKVELVINVVGEDRNFLRCAKMRNIVEKNIEALGSHEKKGDMLLRYGLIDGQPRCGAHIPVKELVGQVASIYLEGLQALLMDVKAGRIAIHEMQGIGKTILMKHLHYCAQKWIERFDFVFWVTLSQPFSIRHVQDAVAAAVMCDLSTIDDLIIRAQKLSYTLAGFGRFVLFLDAVPESFSLEEVGIPVPTEGSMCKLVLSTKSALVCEMLDCFGKLKLDPLPEAEACQLFMYEARIEIGSISSLNEVSSALAKECYGVPSIIVDIATRMRGINDLCEWRNA